jgi:hypothetical protein
LYFYSSRRFSYVPPHGKYNSRTRRGYPENGNYYGNPDQGPVIPGMMDHARQWCCKHTDAGETGAGPDSKFCGWMHEWGKTGDFLITSISA